MKNGFFISLEGLDGTGKTTLSKHLYEHYRTTVTRMPGGTDFAEAHREACRNADISDTVQVLFYSALILDNHEKVIKPKLAAGGMVISDRGFGSTFAYQAFPNGHEKLLLGILENSSIAVPDLTLYIDVDMQVALRREAYQDRVDVLDRYSQFDILQKEKIKEAYDLLYIRQTRTKHHPYPFERDVTTWKIRDRVTKALEVVDGNLPYAEVLQSCKNYIDQHIQKAITEKRHDSSQARVPA